MPRPGATTSIANRSRLVREPSGFHVTPPSLDCKDTPLAPTTQNCPEPDDETAFRFSVAPDSARIQESPRSLLSIVPDSPTAMTTPAESMASPSSAFGTPDAA